MDGKGEVTLAMVLNFIPAQLLPFPTYRGIFVEQTIQLVNQSSQFDEPMGDPLEVVPLGSIVIVTVQVKPFSSTKEQLKGKAFGASEVATERP